MERLIRHFKLVKLVVITLGIICKFAMVAYEWQTIYKYMYIICLTETEKLKFFFLNQRVFVLLAASKEMRSRNFERRHK